MNVSAGSKDLVIAYAAASGSYTALGNHEPSRLLVRAHRRWRLTRGRLLTLCINLSRAWRGDEDALALIREAYAEGVSCDLSGFASEMMMLSDQCAAAAG